MDYFGINSADELPKISEVFLEEVVRATEVNGMQESDEENIHVHDVVGESGELHIAEGEVPTHIHVEAHSEEVTLTEQSNEEEILAEIEITEEIKQDKQNDNEEEAS